MKLFSLQIFNFSFLSSLLLLSTAAGAVPSKGGEDREVRIAFVDGDVRISRGHDHRPDLNQPWEQAQDDELVEQGYTLATGQGRAEIEFENGSTVYLAANSLLLFRELGAPGDRIVSRVSLATGTATFSLQPAADESFYIETPTDKLHVAAPETFFARVDSYLDATAITAQGEKGETMFRPALPTFQLQKGKTLFLRGGDIVQLLDRGKDESGALEPSQGSSDAWESILQSLPDFQIPPMAHPQTQIAQKRDLISSLANKPTQGASEWDTWVSTRAQKRATVTAAALKASGLSAPIPGLVDLYEHGIFFKCEHYGTCWEATDPDESQDYSRQSAAPGPESTAAGQAPANVPFQPQTVQWEQRWVEWCGPETIRTITRVAHTPEELQKLLRKKRQAELAMLQPAHFISGCEQKYWIQNKNCASIMSTQDFLNGGIGYCEHLTLLVTPHQSTKCVGKKCKPVHPPHPLWARVNGKVGFVPAHPNDVKGKPPLNLKHGIFIPPARPGEPVTRISWDPSQKVKLLGRAPKEFQAESLSRTLPVSAPVIRAHLLAEAVENNSLPGSTPVIPPIKYDYASHHFVMAASSVAGGKLREVPVGGIDSHGKIGSFADGRHSSFAQAFGRSDTAESYHGGSFGSGGRGGYGSGSSGGGHASGYSSGSYSSGSHSSGSGSSSGGSSHSSGGGGWSSGSSSGSSGGGSSSSSSSSSGGGSRGKP